MRIAASIMYHVAEALALALGFGFGLLDSILWSILARTYVPVLRDA
jgi:hypothetical protein